MIAVIMHEIHDDCRANDGGRPAIRAYEIASGIIEIDTANEEKSTELQCKDLHYMYRDMSQMQHLLTNNTADKLIGVAQKPFAHSFRHFFWLGG